MSCILAPLCPFPDDGSWEMCAGVCGQRRWQAGLELWNPLAQKAGSKEKLNVFVVIKNASLPTTRGNEQISWANKQNWLFSNFHNGKMEIIIEKKHNTQSLD